MTRNEVRFALVNAAAIALTLVAAFQPWVADGGEVPMSIERKYLPFALAIAAAGTLLVARFLPAERRDAFLMRHHAVYAVVPLLLFTQSRMGNDVRQAVLGALYLLAFGAWTVHALDGVWHVIAQLRDRTGALLLAAVLLVPFLALLPYHRGVMPTASDEPHYLVIVQSLLSGHGLDLKATYDSEVYRAYYPDRLPDRHIIDVGPAQYPIRDLGLPVLITPAFAIAGRTAVLVLLCFVGAALVAQLYLACRDLGVSARPALLAVSGVALAHPLLTYTTQIYPELPAALAFVTAARLLRDGRETSPLRLALASACVGTLPWLSARAWLIAVGVGLVVAYCALRPRRPTAAALASRVVAGAAPFAALVLLLAYIDYRMYGVFIPNAGYYLIRDQQQVLAFTPHIGALGLLFDRVFGLIPRTPLFLVAALGVVPLWRRARNAELAALALGWLVYFLYVANIAYWWADGSPPSRYLLGGLPFLVVLLAAGIERIGGLGSWRTPATWIACGLAAYSLFVSYVYSVLPNIRYDLALDIHASGSPGGLFEFLGRVLRPNPSVFFPSLVRADGLDVVLGVAWLALVALLIALGAKTPDLAVRRSRSVPAEVEV